MAPSMFLEQTHIVHVPPKLFTFVYQHMMPSAKFVLEPSIPMVEIFIPTYFTFNFLEQMHDVNILPKLFTGIEGS
jgi:hypothetical protein